jgi:hypothetical protein
MGNISIQLIAFAFFGQGQTYKNWQRRCEIVLRVGIANATILYGLCQLFGSIQKFTIWLKYNPFLFIKNINYLIKFINIIKHIWLEFYQKSMCHDYQRARKIFGGSPKLGCGVRRGRQSGF